jgi:hypothetical protein
MVFSEAGDFRALRRLDEIPKSFRALARLPDQNFVPVTDGLVAWYRFADGDATDYTNELGVGTNQTAFDGTVNGASFDQSGGVTDFRNGSQSGAFDFDGVDDFIKPNAQPLDSTSDMTVSFFVSPDDTDISRLLHTNNDQNGFRIFYDNETVDGSLSLFEDSGNRDAFTTTPSVPIGQFTQIAVTFDSSLTEANLLTNGTLRDTITTTGSGSDPIDVEIGGAAFKGSFFFNGIIDDVRIYDRALSVSEINQIYQNTKPQ